MTKAMLAAAAALALSVSGARAGVGDDYPTAAKADYVFGCMAANGQTPQSLDQCSCSIDTIATILPYADYEEAETVLRMNKVAGHASELFRSSAELKDKVAAMRRAQAEANVKCFD